MASTLPNICVCICTFRRPLLLGALLEELGQQETGGLFTISSVVVDNDATESARGAVDRVQGQLPYPVRYFVETQQNIALARNKAVGNADGEFLAFIDDDETPTKTWLLQLFQTRATTGAAGVLGPVRPLFESPPPRWAIKSGLYERPECPTGTKLAWQDTRTGNALLTQSVLRQLNPPFRANFGNGGEDQDFFRRLIELGHTFVWCNEAVVHEYVPPARVSRKYLIKRALLRGQNEKNGLTFISVVKSLVAVLLYTVLIPFLLFFGQHVVLKFLIKLFDHIGKLCAALGLRPMGTKYLTS